MWAHLQLCAVESNNLWIHTRPGSSTNCWPETMGTFLLPYYQWFSTGYNHTRWFLANTLKTWWMFHCHVFFFENCPQAIFFEKIEVVAGNHLSFTQLTLRDWSMTLTLRKKSRASNHRRLDWSIAWVVGNCMPFVAIRKVWQNVGM